MSDPTDRVVVVGAGPVGCTLAIVLRARGVPVELYEKRADLRRDRDGSGRSINLVLTDRGLRALEALGLRERALELTVSVLGRMMHDVSGELSYQPYGKDDSECNYSVSRSGLNAFLLQEAEDRGVPVHFERELVRADFEQMRLHFQGPDGAPTHIEAACVIGADGAGSGVRAAMAEVAPGYTEQTDWLAYGYKELPIPAGPDGGYQLEENALHIWPRGDEMLMGLANLDGSFTGTVYLPMEGDEASFEALSDPARVEAYFARQYPDALELVPELGREFLRHPVGPLGTMRCSPWHLRDRALLVGDAAHAIVPFFGQGLNSGLEDCAVLDELIEAHGWPERGAIFAAFDARRKPNGDAIAEMALENFVEMRDRVGDERFLLRKQIERRIEQHMSQLYRSRYATVVYSRVPYRDARDAGRIQSRILEKLMEGITDAEQVDLDEARALIEQRLTPFYEERGVDIARF